MDQRDGKANQSWIARSIGLPEIRISGFLAQAQKLLNLDG